jgi:hypothetical protein
MCLFIILGLILVIIGLVMLFIHWPTWPMGVSLIAGGLLLVAFFGWAYKKIFTDRIK